MNSINNRLTLVLILVFISSIGSFHLIKETHASTDTAHEKVEEAFVLIHEAELAHGDVTGLVDRLNFAVNLLSQSETLPSGDSSKPEDLRVQSEEMANQVISDANSVRADGLIGQRNSSIFLAVELVFLTVLCVVIYRFGPRVFWGLWLILNRESRVRT